VSNERDRWPAERNAPGLDEDGSLVGSKGDEDGDPKDRTAEAVAQELERREREVTFGLLLGENEFPVGRRLGIDGAFDRFDLPGHLLFAFVGLGLPEELGVGPEGLGHRALSLDLAVLERDDVVSDRLGHADVVRDEQDGPITDERRREEFLDDPLGRVDIERTEDIVKQQDLSVRVDGAGERDPRLLATTESEALLCKGGSSRPTADHVSHCSGETPTVSLDSPPTSVSSPASKSVKSRSSAHWWTTCLYRASSKGDPKRILSFNVLF